MGERAAVERPREGALCPEHKAQVRGVDRAPAMFHRSAARLVLPRGVQAMPAVRVVLAARRRWRRRPGNTVFRYDAQGPQDVVVVDARGYAECTAPDNAPALTSGDDHVVLGQAGQFFFICEAEGECEGGMKLAVTVH
ncbi:unnamed protein product [Urochloa decumbens]|uniref:Phytocyanin domain-containing protein n=1 Tax=Urochloa decumbens TaxID=240449 RepID=A0ABC8Y4Z0_9POAL